jgi:hypothetical protein
VYGDPFPGRGVPHWELYAVDEKGKLGESVVSCREEIIVRAFEAWLLLGAPTPALSSEPPNRDHLGRIGRIAAPAPSLKLRGEASAVAARLPPDERQRFEADVSSLAGPRVAHFFPRGDDGRVGSGEVVLLTAYGSEERGRRLWLHVVATRKRSLEIGLDAFIGENHAHRWDGARWMWDTRVEMPSRAQRWGIDEADARIGRTLQLLDQGWLGEALAIWGIGWTSEVALVAAGKPLSMNDAALADRWAEALRRELWELAPWKLPSALPPTAHKAERLMTFPGQHQIRKASLMLTQTPSGLELRLEFTGTNSRMPELAFKRLVEQDLARFGMLDGDPPGLAASGPTPIQVVSPRPIDIEKETARLREKLRHFEGDGYKSAVQAARRLGQELAASPLNEATRDPDPRVRRRALELAAELGVGACCATAFERLEDKDKLVRMAASDLLRRMRYPPALPAVARRMLAQPDDFLTAASTLRNWGEKAGVEAFRTHLSSDDPQIRAAASLAIVQCGGKALIPDLLRLAQHDEPLVASAALRALEVLDGTQLALAEAFVEARLDGAEVRRARLRWATYKRY